LPGRGKRKSYVFCGRSDAPDPPGGRSPAGPKLVGFREFRRRGGEEERASLETENLRAGGPGA